MKLLLTLISGIIVLLLTASIGMFAVSPETIKNHPSIKQLVDLLDHDEFETREEASRQLTNRTDGLAALLVAARYSPSVEVRQRAGDLVKILKPKLTANRTKLLFHKIKRGDIDWVVDRMPSYPNEVNNPICNSLSHFAEAVRERANKLSDKTTPPIEINDIVGGVTSTELPLFDKELDIRERRILADEIPSRVGFVGCLLISRGSVRCTQRIATSLVLANGNVRVGRLGRGCGTIHDSIVVCDGSIEADDAVRCVLIATGTIKIEVGIRESTIVIPNATTPLGLLHFFDPRDTGLEAEFVKRGEVKVNTLMPGQAFAEAGILPGDVLTAADGVILTDMNLFRRMVRSASAANDVLLFTVLRNSKVLKIPVAFVD